MENENKRNRVVYNTNATCTEETDNQHKALLFENLTHIAPNDYAGKDYCRVCWVRLLWNSRSLNCDSCGYWSHQACSDMPLAEYLSKRGKIFAWTCTRCRTEEDRPDPMNTLPRLSEPEKTLKVSLDQIQIATIKSRFNFWCQALKLQTLNFC